MEDTHIKSGHYAYSLRVDVDNTDDLTLINKWKAHYNATFWIIGKEVSSLGKPHFQCIFWFQEKQSMPKLRNWWKGKTSQTKQPISFTSAKRIGSLAKYTMKDSKYTTNLSVEEVEMIGKWKDKKDKKKAFMEELYSFATYSADRIKGLAEQHDYEPNVSVQQDYIVELLEFYRKHNKRPNRSTIHYILWKEKFQTSRQLASDWFHHLLSY